MTTVLKLGGSVVTEKRSEESVDETALSSVAADLATASEIVLVHGGGSFGHPAAAAHGVTDTDGTGDAAAVADIHDAMTRLSDHVCRALREAGVPAVPVRPLSSARREGDGTLRLATTAVEGLLAEGFVPVAHGDVVAHETAGVTVLSGDEVVVALAERLTADRVGLCSTVPGVLVEGEVVDRIDQFADVADAFERDDATDVTGGMAAKVRALLGLSAPAHVFGPAALSAFLAGEAPGTEVRGPRTTPEAGTETETGG